MKLTAPMMLSVDGVYQGPGGPDEDRRGGLNLRLYPVVVGDGLRFFPEQGQTHALTLVESRSVPSGVTLLTYRPAGRARFGNAGE